MTFINTIFCRTLWRNITEGNRFAWQDVVIMSARGSSLAAIRFSVANRADSAAGCLGNARPASGAPGRRSRHAVTLFLGAAAGF